MINFQRILSRILLIGIILNLCNCVREKEEPEWYLQAGDKLPQFEVVTLDGQKVSSNDSYTATLIIIFFNTTCVDCQRELPLLQTQYEENLKLPVSEQSRYICISREENAVDVERYWNEHQLTMPVSAQVDRNVYSKFASVGIPRIFYAKDGLIIKSE